MRENPKKVHVATRGNSLDFGSFGLVAQETKEIWANQIEAARKDDGKIHKQRRKNLDKNFYRYAYYEKSRPK